MAIAMICTGTALVIFTLALLMMRRSFSLDWPVTGGAGAILLVVGVLILITELMEVWLTRGQTALVDGLQAG